MTRMQNEPEDRHELYRVIRQKLNDMKAFGLPLTDDLVRFEQQLEAEFAQDKAGWACLALHDWVYASPQGGASAVLGCGTRKSRPSVTAGQG